MARTNFKAGVLEAMGFRRRNLGEGQQDYVLQLRGGWSVEYQNGSIELVHDGNSVPLNCRGEAHLRDLIRVL